MTGLQQRRDKNIKRSCCRPVAVVFVCFFFVAFTLPLLLLLFIVFTFSQATPTSASASASAPAPDDVDVVVVCFSRCHGAMTTSFWGVYECECASVRLCVCATYTCAICCSCCCCCLLQQQHGQSSMHLYAEPVYGFL